MINLLEQLQFASKTLLSLREPDVIVRFLLAQLGPLDRADLVLLYRPAAAPFWHVVDALPETIDFATQPIQVPVGETCTSGQKSALEQIIAQRTAACFQDPLRAGGFDFSHLRLIEIEQRREIVSSLLLPLAEAGGRVTQIVELLRLDQGPNAKGFSVAELAAASILTQQAEFCLQHAERRRETSDLFESLLQLIGSAIDEKSPYAGDHCRRVPVLTLLMARAVDRSQSEAFRDIRFTDTDLYELEVAAWLHDIGKLVTPIQITDKATKLERSIDRLDLVRTRFEILHRDLEIAQLKAGSAGGDISLPETANDPLQMLDDLRFIADCNRGRNSLTLEETRRVREIAKRYHWIDRQGETLPVLTDDEATNLMVVRGTITDAEREMINHHIVSTINMLDMLPFPAELSRVPEIAAAHHEFHNGQGFPSGLRGDQMLIQSRILSFADLFESVSSGSRPYKKRNSLSQSLQIMHEMVDSGQVDPDLYRLFIEENLYEGFALEFLSREQIDPVDRKALLAGI